MITPTMNPYPSLNSDYTTLLNVIKAAPPADLNALSIQIATWVQSTYFPAGTPPDMFIVNQLKTQGATAINGFVNSNLLSDTSGGVTYNPQQLAFINQMVNGIFGVPIQSIGDFITDLEDNITRSGLMQEFQIPLLQATSVGTAAIIYWNTQVQSPGGWGPYFDQSAANSAYNRINVPFWVSAAMEGALLGTNKAAVYGLIDPPKVAGVDLTGALVGAAMVSAAKVLFKTSKRFQNTPFASLKLDSQVVGSMGGNGSGGTTQFLNSTLNGSCSHWLCNTQCQDTRCNTGWTKPIQKHWCLTLNGEVSCTNPN